MANSKSIGVAFLDQDIIGAQYLLADEQLYRRRAGYGYAGYRQVYWRHAEQASRSHYHEQRVFGYRH